MPKFKQKPFLFSNFPRCPDRQALLDHAYRSVLHARGSKIASQFLHEFGAKCVTHVDLDVSDEFRAVAAMLLAASD